MEPRLRGLQVRLCLVQLRLLGRQALPQRVCAPPGVVLRGAHRPAQALHLQPQRPQLRLTDVVPAAGAKQSYDSSPGLLQ